MSTIVSINLPVSNTSVTDTQKLAFINKFTNFLTKTYEINTIEFKQLIINVFVAIYVEYPNMFRNDDYTLKTEGCIYNIVKNILDKSIKIDSLCHFISDEQEVCINKSINGQKKCTIHVDKKSSEDIIMEALFQQVQESHNDKLNEDDITFIKSTPYYKLNTDICNKLIIKGTDIDIIKEINSLQTFCNTNIQMFENTLSVIDFFLSAETFVIHVPIQQQNNNVVNNSNNVDIMKAPNGKCAGSTKTGNQCNRAPSTKNDTDVSNPDVNGKVWATCTAHARHDIHPSINNGNGEQNVQNVENVQSNIQETHNNVNSHVNGHEHIVENGKCHGIAKSTGGNCSRSASKNSEHCTAPDEQGRTYPTCKAHAGQSKSLNNILPNNTNNTIGQNNSTRVVSDDKKCSGVTKKGERCSKYASDKFNTSDGKKCCSQHAGQPSFTQ